MSDTTCPHCGGPIVANNPVCEYCGSALAQSNAMGKWTAIKDHLPPPSTENPDHSILVLVSFGKDGGRIKQKDGTIDDLYESSLKAAQYDYQKKIWHNSFYGERAEPIYVTHWMPLPPSNSPDWIPTVLKTPQVVGTDDFSIYVLTCDKTSEYIGSVIAACNAFIDSHWHAPLDALSDDEDALGHITVSHWMPLPDRPEA